LQSRVDTMKGRNDFANRGRAVVVSLVVPHILYHPQRFREELQEKAESTCLLTQCVNTWYPDTQGWTNKNFLYADARRHLGLGEKPKGTEDTARSIDLVGLTRILPSLTSIVLFAPVCIIHVYNLSVMGLSEVLSNWKIARPRRASAQRRVSAPARRAPVRRAPARRASAGSAGSGSAGSGSAGRRVVVKNMRVFKCSGVVLCRYLKDC
jgi:hypothetical protein